MRDLERHLGAGDQRQHDDQPETRPGPGWHHSFVQARATAATATPCPARAPPTARNTALAISAARCFPNFLFSSSWWTVSRICSRCSSVSGGRSRAGACGAEACEGGSAPRRHSAARGGSELPGRLVECYPDHRGDQRLHLAQPEPQGFVPSPPVTQAPQDPGITDPRQSCEVGKLPVGLRNDTERTMSRIALPSAHGGISA